MWQNGIPCDRSTDDHPINFYKNNYNNFHFNFAHMNLKLGNDMLKTKTNRKLAWAYHKRDAPQKCVHCNTVRVWWLGWLYSSFSLFLNQID